MTTSPDETGSATVTAAPSGPALPLAARVEALLVSTDRPLTDARLVELLEETGGADATKRVKRAIDEINEAYADGGRAMRIERLAGGWQVLTRREFGPIVARLHRDRHQARLSTAALETLSIIAYRQPIIRAEIEAIRGVACGEVLRGLLERRLVKIAGRAEELGRPMLYGTTREFLKVFGLSSLDDLPEIEGLDPKASRRRGATAAKPEAPEAPEGADPAGGGDAEGEADDPPAAGDSGDRAGPDATGA